MKPALTILLLVAAARAQSPDNAAKFEFADVHVSPPVANPNMRGGALRGGRFEVRMATMTDLIGFAYDMEPDKILGGPRWLDWDRFDVSAKASPATKHEDLNAMLRNLLVERFQLVVHRDTKPMPAFVLTVGKGKPKMKPANSSADGSCQDVPQNAAPGAVPYQAISCHNVSMTTLAQALLDRGGFTYFSDP